ncbi:hypothetical protein [Alkalinema pantanalense]|uniref:hypothetical protein n=1 Tax=Alkalinema pantanalense TaxID=1620705 RepID=UPI003D6FDF8A
MVFLLGSGSQNLLFFIQAWEKQYPTSQLLQIVGFLAWITYFSHILESQSMKILRFYEGYWNFPLGKYLNNFGSNYYRKHLDFLDARLQKNPDDECYEEIYINYPLPLDKADVMPTRLGNILKNSELYPYRRYKIDAVLIWPRLYYLLPERFIQSIAEARGALEFLLSLSILSGFFACISGIYLIVVGGSWQLFLACFWGGFLVSWLAYQGALDSAICCSQQIKAAFDLYRNEVFKKMRLPLPMKPGKEDERAKWQMICAFLYRNKVGSLIYTNENNEDDENNRD